MLISMDSMYMHETGGSDSTQHKIHSPGRLERSSRGGKLYVGVCVRVI